MTTVRVTNAQARGLLQLLDAHASDIETPGQAATADAMWEALYVAALAGRPADLDPDLAWRVFGGLDVGDDEGSWHPRTVQAVNAALDKFRDGATAPH